MATQNTIISKLSTDNYPYGRLKCTMYFWVEFNPKKGYRAVTQSINPKNGRLNAPKAGTYSDFIWLTQDENGFIKFNHCSLTYDGVDKFITLLNNHPEFTFTPAESEYFWATVISNIKINAAYANSFGSRFKEGVTLDQYFEKLAFKAIIKAFKDRLDIRTLTALGYDKNAADALIIKLDEKAEVIPHSYS